MNVVEAFWAKLQYKDSEQPLKAWYAEATRARWQYGAVDAATVEMQ
jgi:hypothetical protein